MKKLIGWQIFAFAFLISIFLLQLLGGVTNPVKIFDACGLWSLAAFVVTVIGHVVAENLHKPLPTGAVSAFSTIVIGIMIGYFSIIMSIHWMLVPVDLIFIIFFVGLGYAMSTDVSKNLKINFRWSASLVTVQVAVVSAMIIVCAKGLV